MGAARTWQRAIIIISITKGVYCMILLEPRANTIWMLLYNTTMCCFCECDLHLFNFVVVPILFPFGEPYMFHRYCLQCMFCVLNWNRFFLSLTNRWVILFCKICVLIKYIYMYVGLSMYMAYNHGMFCVCVFVLILL